MKKKTRLMRNAGLVALSAVMACGAAVAFAGCKNDTYTLTVDIFCGTSDEYTNSSIFDKWAKEYSEKLGFEVDVEPNFSNNKDDYFVELNRKFQSNAAADVIYLSPKYVNTWAETGRVMDLSPYILKDTNLNTKASNVDAIGKIWNDGFSYYGYKKGSKTYVMGQSVGYDQGKDKFVAENGEEAEIYGLPKDYSNFAMGYNKKFFTNDLKKAYTTHKASDVRNVKGAANLTANVTFTGKQSNGNAYSTLPVTYAASGTYTNPYNGETMNAVAGQEAPIINVGVPTTYKTFNFYRYASYDDALAAGDPMAVQCDAYTLGDGYTVTIPGFPGETFDVPADQRDANAPYDTATGHIVFTYAEFGALTWAITYYLNTFDWDAADPTQGVGGVKPEGTNIGQQNIFGNEQYESAQGNPLYLLTWLAANDADFIDTTSTKVMNGTAPDKESAAKASTLASKQTNPTTKLNLDGTERKVDVQYGVNSERFIETYGAFQEYGSTWNGNSGNAGDYTSGTRNESGWDFFRMGAGVFYGAGTWDAATRNESSPDNFEFGEMPAPVAEKYALYSQVRNADYDVVEYSNGATQKGTGDSVNNDGVQRSKPSDGKVVYTKADIAKNQLLRQDKWAARMDSVGYAANADLLNKVGTDEEWKIEGAASLIMALTIDEQVQQTLTYAGAQLPNFSKQCIEFLNYQDAAYQTTGTFKDMLTPNGWATTTDAAEGRKIWDHYYKIAVAMADASKKGSENGVTVDEWINKNAKDYNSNEPAKYDPQYKDTLLEDFVGAESTNYSFAMKVLRMCAFDKTDRDLNIRMQYGLNSVRDSGMYTPNTVWLGRISPPAGKMLAYNNQKTLDNAVKGSLAAYVQTAPGVSTLSDGKAMAYMTPATFCIRYAEAIQKDLDDAIKEANK
ncbi:MAG: hypothetical protein K2N74_04220 [Clostridiales bacterium]|nr:hypothetical protein [Clostridiales bacterium]